MRLLSILLVFTITLCFNSRTPGGVRREKAQVSLASLTRFNSRTPGGVRQYTLLVSVRDFGFNSRTPGGVRQTITHIIRDVKRFNSRTPGGVRHHASAITDSKIISFNSRTPGGVRPQGREIPYQGYQVSIHAPREGCDYLQNQLISSQVQFQFTHPGRGATLGLGKSVPVVSVSIHAPREGCDREGKDPQPLTACFNSRTPGGVRLDDTQGGAY